MNIEEAINATNEEIFTPFDEVEETTETEEVETPQGTDYFQEQITERLNTKAPSYRGARPRMKIDFSMIEDAGLPAHFKQAQRDSEYYTSIGNKQYASMIKQQYMDDYFLPALDALVRMNSMEAVLGNRDILEQLDAYTLLDGTRGNGYTQAYIQAMYEPTDVAERSDAEVERAVRRLTTLCEDDQIRLAVGEAKQMLRNINEGHNLATSEDLALISKVANYL